MNRSWLGSKECSKVHSAHSVCSLSESNFLKPGELCGAWTSKLSGACRTLWSLDIKTFWSLDVKTFWSLDVKVFLSQDYLGTD